MADLSIARLMTANDAYQPLRFASGQSSGLSTDAPLGAARPPTEAETRAVEAAERAPESKWFYIKRVGYNDMKVRLELNCNGISRLTLNTLAVNQRGMKQPASVLFTG